MVFFLFRPHSKGNIFCIMAGFKISISIIFYQTSIATKLPLILEKLQLVTSKFLIVLKDDIVLFAASIKSCRNVIH